VPPPPGLYCSTAIAALWFVLFSLTVAVNATNRPPGPLGSATAAKYGLAYRDVAFRAADGCGCRPGTSRRATGLAVLTTDVGYSNRPHSRLDERRMAGYTPFRWLGAL
jgi:hypothetical protein